jgi:hypothetical protein
MPVLLSDRARRWQYWNQSIPDENPHWDRFPPCPHFTGNWTRVMPLLSICAFLIVMVMLVFPRIMRNIYTNICLECRVDAQEAIRTALETYSLGQI